MNNVVAIATFPIHPDKVEAATEALTRCVEATHQEQGLLRYALHRDAQQSQRLALVEVYESPEARQLHRNEPHLAALLSDLDGMLAGPIEVVTLEPLPTGDAAKGMLA